MTSAERQSRALGVLGGVVLLAAVGGCAWFQSLYNAERIFADAEQDRLAGREGLARARYDSALAKAGRIYRQEPEGGSADEALYLLGRIWLRLDDLPRARAAFEEALDTTDEPELELAARLHLGAVLTRSGERREGLLMMNEAIRELESGPLRAEGHLWRARNLLEVGNVSAGWWDLDRAVENDPRLGPATDLERVVWGVARDDPERALQATRRLLRAPPAYVGPDTLESLIQVAGRRWGPAAAARLLDPVDESRWAAEPRGRLLLLRAGLALEAGDTAAAWEDAADVADGFTEYAAPARLLMGRLALARARSFTDLTESRSILLPSSGDPRVRELLESVQSVLTLAAQATDQDEPLALFAAAETARDRLGAPNLARALFLGYADMAGPSPWVGKALLAALALPGGETERRELRRRLDLLSGNPYVQGARTGRFHPDEFTRLESELARRLTAIRADVRDELARRSVLDGPDRRPDDLDGPVRPDGPDGPDGP